MILTRPKNVRHSHCEVKTDPFYLIKNLMTFKKFKTLKNCYNVVFLFHSFLVLTVNKKFRKGEKAYNL